MCATAVVRPRYAAAMAKHSSAEDKNAAGAEPTGAESKDTATKDAATKDAATKDAGVDDNDVKRKFREALERKNAKSSSSADHLDAGAKQPRSHGPVENRREFRRKSG
jgi:hypothetical protein